MGLRGPGAKPVKRPEQRREPAQVVGLPGRTRAERLINWIERLTVPGGVHAGRPFKPQPWQKGMIREIYRTDRKGRRTVRLALISMGRKNGKTGLAAALALAHLCGPEAVRGGQVLSGAADRRQASIIYENMKAMALASPELADRLAFRDFKKEIEDVETSSTYRAFE